MTKTQTNYLFIVFLFFLSFQAKATIEIFEVKGVSSANDCTGYISIKIDGNSGPYDISARNTTTSTVIATTYTNVKNGVYSFLGLCAGDYDIFVTDKNIAIAGTSLCTRTMGTSVVICKPFSIVTDAMPKIVCGEDKTGSINVSVGYPSSSKYLWSSGQTTKDISGLEGDKVYTLTVTDFRGCTASKSITIDGQKVNFDIDMVFAGVPCTGSAQLSSIGTTGSVSSNNFQITWLLPQAVNNVKEVKGLCDDKTYNVVVTSEQGCKATKSFNLPKCSNKPLSLLSVDTKKVLLTQYASKYLDLNSRYCREDTQIHIQIEGGTPPIKYTFKRPLGSIIQSGVIDVPKYLFSSYWKSIALNSEKPVIEGDYVFEAIDACGNKQKKVFECDCKYIQTHFHNAGYPAAYGLCHTNIIKSGVDVIDPGYPLSGVSDRTFYFHWPDNTTSTYFHKYKHDCTFTNVSGPTGWKPSKNGFYEIKVDDEYGCDVRNYCVNFGTKSVYCNSVPRTIENTYKYKKYGSDIESIKNKLVFYNSSKDFLCGFEYGFTKDCTSLTEWDKENPYNDNPFNRQDNFIYIPQDPFFPCKYGLLKDACGEVFEMVGGDEYYDVSKKECYVDCACIFEGQLNKAPYKYQGNIPAFVQTKKKLSIPEVDCSKSTVSTNPPTLDSDDYDCSSDDIVIIPASGSNQVDCLFDIYCKDDLITTKEYLPTVCVKIASGADCEKSGTQCKEFCDKPMVIEYCDPLKVLSCTGMTVLDSDDIPYIVGPDTYKYKHKIYGKIDLHNCDCYVNNNGTDYFDTDITK